jgi:hypothetical protein
MPLTRKQFLGGAAASALAAAGVYELVDQLAGSPKRAAVTGTHPAEQHLLNGVRTVVDNDVEVLVPPLHHQVVTATLKVGEDRAALVEAGAELERVLHDLDARYAPTPAGLGVTVGWGLPYFRRYVPGQAARHLPLDRRATGTRGKPVRALEDSMRFPSDPDDVVLERNDVAVLLRSDSLDNVADGAKTLFGGLDSVFKVTSVRKGFAGGGFDGGRSLPKQMALAAGVPGADLIPESSELFLGFTSTQKRGLGPARIANIETLGYADLGPRGFFARGTHMHVSHLFEDLEAWYLNFSHQQRLDTTFRPGLTVAATTLTVPQAHDDIQSERQVAHDYGRYRTIGHSGAIQPASRLARDVIGHDGTLYPKGTAVPQRADFNTLDNPFFWSADPQRDNVQSGPAAGIHFVVFNPTSDDFRRTRLAMDGIMPDGSVLSFDRGSRGQGFNSILTTTHRQNFLVPPRAHRSFPLSELRA